MLLVAVINIGAYPFFEFLGPDLSWIDISSTRSLPF